MANFVCMFTCVFVFAASVLFSLLLISISKSQIQFSTQDSGSRLESNNLYFYLDLLLPASCFDLISLLSPTDKRYGDLV